MFIYMQTLHTNALEKNVNPFILLSGMGKNDWLIFNDMSTHLGLFYT